MKYLITGGGTAGHINPAIAIAKEIKKNEADAQILFVGTKKGHETDLVPREGFEIKFIEVAGFRRKLSLDTIKTIIKLVKSFSAVRKILKEYRPDYVIGTGGYVCGPVLYLAAKRKIPTLIHEQNVFPGVTNKILSKHVDTVAISFTESKKYLSPKSKHILTGNPIRHEIIEAFEFRKNHFSDKKTVTIFGGSLGAEAINEAVTDMIKKHKNNIDFNINFATGKKHYEEAVKRAGNLPENIKITPYIYNMAEVLKTTDIAVCRAGAITIAELTLLAIPSILIPSPYVADDHQSYNAKALEEKEAAILLPQNTLNADVLFEKITSMLKDNKKLKKMGEKAQALSIPDATKKIYQAIKSN